MAKVEEMEGIVVCGKPGIATHLRNARAVAKRLQAFSETDREFLNLVVDPTTRVRGKRYPGYGSTKTYTTTTTPQDVNVLLDRVFGIVEKLELCAEMATRFRIVELDTTAKREVPVEKVRVGRATRKAPKKKAKKKKRKWATGMGRIQEGPKRQAAPKKKAPKPVKTINVPLIFHTRLPAEPSVTIKVSSGRYTVTSKTPAPTTEAMRLIKEMTGTFDHFECWWVPNNLKVNRVVRKPAPRVADPIVVGVINVPKIQTYHFELTRWVDESIEDGWWSHEAY
jgi:hypothetical protein